MMSRGNTILIKCFIALDLKYWPKSKKDQPCEPEAYLGSCQLSVCGNS